MREVVPAVKEVPTTPRGILREVSTAVSVARTTPTCVYRDVSPAVREASATPRSICREVSPVVVFRSASPSRVVRDVSSCAGAGGLAPEANTGHLGWKSCILHLFNFVKLCWYSVEHAFENKGLYTVRQSAVHDLDCEGVSDLLHGG